jgi:hypothetical protein
MENDSGDAENMRGIVSGVVAGTVSATLGADRTTIVARTNGGSATSAG